MKCRRAFKFRVYPDAKRQREIDERLVLAQRLYNKLLERAKREYGRGGEQGINRAAFNRYLHDIITEDKEFLRLYSQTRQDIRDRVIRSYQNFFRRCREKKNGRNVKVGFPRFKSMDRYKSIIYPQDNGSFSIEKDRLRVSRIGTMKIEMHRDIGGGIKALTIKREAGDYYAIFTTEQIIDPPRIDDTNPAGMDMGLRSFVALSDGTTIRKPKFFKKRARRIAHWQRVISRRKKGSKRRQRARERLQREWQRATNQSDDFMHRLSNRLVNSGYTSFAAEKLDIQNMMKDHSVAQSIQNASWNRFIQMLSYKAESAGMEACGIDPRETTQECSR